MGKSAYSLHIVPSPLLNWSAHLADKLTSLLLTWADTTPRVAGIELGAPRYAYAKDGKPEEAAVALTVFMEGGSKAYWDLARQADASEARLEVTRSHAAIEGIPFSVFSKDSFYANRVELKNRQSMQRMLWLGRDLDTRDLEAGGLLALCRDAMTCADLAEQLDASLCATQVACFRLHLRGLVRLPLGQEFLSSRWLVERTAA